jgi:hypothetical protein
VPYRDEFLSKLQRDPLRHTARMVQHQFRLLGARLKARARTAHDAAQGGLPIHPSPQQLLPPPHHYQGYSGPWIEDYFFDFFVREKIQSGLTYLPVFWTDYFLQAQVHKYTPAQFEKIERLLRNMLDGEIAAGGSYFTLLEYDHPIWDWHLFPKNVLVFSAGGSGDIPIPLFKGSPPLTLPAKDVAVSFAGRLGGASNKGGIRERMAAAMAGHAVFFEGSAWRDLMARSVFSLCPRGLGRASYRLYEALSVSSIPIYIWDDLPWLPYAGELPWDEFSISLPIDEIGSLPERISRWSEKKVLGARALIAKNYDSHFTLEGACRQVVHMTHRLQNDLAAITSRRVFNQ